MKIKIASIILLSLAFFINTIASDRLYIPVEIKKAIEKGSRTNLGVPGENYFVNQADYNIRAEFNPETNILKGEEVIFYTNNSNDTLKHIIIHLHQNMLKKGNARDWDAGDSDIHEGVIISKLLCNNRQMTIESDRVKNNRSLIQVRLPEKLIPKAKMKFEIAWSFSFPDSLNARYGRYGEGNYLIAYWYPKMAVYDDIDGWNIHPFTGNQEFYNDPGNYSVEIKVPAEFNLCSSGILQNADDVYTTKIIDRVNRAKQTDSIISIATKEDWENKSVLKKSDDHIWKFKAEQLPDFAFAMSNNYIWDATSIWSGNRRVLIHCFFNSAAPDTELADMARKSIGFFSEDIPAIPYPYPQLCVFESTGMEFPALAGCVINTNKIQNYTTVSHETGHAYFPFKAGFNEQKYAWMDEGLMTFYPLFIIEKELNLNIKIFNFYIQMYNAQAGSISDVPLMVPSFDLSDWETYTFQAYFRSSVAFYELYELTGRDKFTEGLQLFYKVWQGKHPTPYDMFNCFNKVMGEDLSWFWKPWFFDFGYADLRIGEVTAQKDKVSINVYNDGGLPVPIKMKVNLKDGDNKLVELKSDVWKSNKECYTVLLPKCEIASIHLDTQTIPDISPQNNSLIFE